MILEDVKKSTVKIICDGMFCGTGFFYKQNYCITCHHVIYRATKLQIEVDGKIYDAEWIENFSAMEFDVAVLKVNEVNCNPLLCAKEITPCLNVKIWGYTKQSLDKLPAGKEIDGELVTTITKYTSSADEITIKKPWNQKPFVNVDAYQIKCNNAGEGLSGAPIFESERGKIVGIFVGMHEIGSSDFTNEGYVIPIEVILNYQKTDIDKNFPEIDVNLHLDEGNKNLKINNYSDAIIHYSFITKDNNYYNAWFNKGKAYLKLGDNTLALECFEIAAKIIEFQKMEQENKLLLEELKEKIENVN